MLSIHDIIVIGIQKINSEVEDFQWELDNDTECNIQHIYARITFQK